MKQWKKLKKRVAALLIVTLAAANMAPASLAAINLDDLNIGEFTVNAEKDEIYVGETAKFTAQIASVSEASGSSASWSEASMSELEAEINWKLPGGLKQVSASGSELVVEGTGKNTDGTVTAKLGKKSAEAGIKVLDPKLTVRPSSIKLDYGKSAVITAEIDESQLKESDKNRDIFSASASDATPNIDVDGIGLDDNQFNVSAKDGFYGDFNVIVSAELNGGDLVLDKAVKVTINKPNFTVTADAKKLDLLDNPATALKVNDETGLFGSYKWQVTDPEILEISEESGDRATVSALKAGQTTVKVTGTTNIPVGPSGVQPETAEITAEATITVTDSRQFYLEFSGEKDYIELDINPDPEKKKLSDTVKVVNDYGDELILDVLQEFDLVALNYDKATGILTVSTDGNEVGSAQIVVSRTGGKEAFTISVNVKTSEISAEIAPDISVEVGADAVKVPEVKTEGLSEEQHEQVKQAVEKHVETITNALSEAFDTAKQSDAIKTLVSGVEEAAKLYGDLADGDVVTVYPKQTLDKVEFETNVITDEETGEVRTSVVIKKLKFDISLLMDKLSADGSEVLESGTTLKLPADNKTAIQFPIPLPAEGIPAAAKYARITHKKDVSYSAIKEADGVSYVVVTAYGFSPFELEFVESIPTTPAPSRRGGGGKGHSYTPSGTWQSDVNGWYYRQPNGSKAANCWLELNWNGTMQWYHFNENGYMTAGWFTDADGNTYFLHNISDGNQGYMYTGWKQNGGFWYYFCDFTGGPKGSLLRSGVTPDGYVTDANGACLTYPLK